MPGKANEKPESSSFAGITRWLPSTSSANSPSASRNAGAGAGNSVGRRSTRPIAAVTSALVTGFGPVRFTGPVNDSVSRMWRSAATWSCSAMKLQYCLPLPSRPPSPALNSGKSRPHAPPSRPTTSPVRACTVRMPASSAAAVAASHSSQTEGRNPSPGGALSSTARSPVSP